jgi:hypothetical protein
MEPLRKTPYLAQTTAEKKTAAVEPVTANAAANYWW